MVKSVELKEFDINASENFGVYIEYNTNLISDNLYSTTMFIYIINNNGNDVSNIKFDVSYNDTNLSSLSSSTINILSNDEKGASFICNETIPNRDYKCYIVTGIQTSGEFNGMTISNISYDTSNATEEVPADN